MICERCYQSLDQGEHGQYLCPLEPRHVQISVIDDQIEGGPRFFDTMGHEDVWIDSKSARTREMQKRGLIDVNRREQWVYDARKKQHEEKERDEGRW